MTTSLTATEQAILHILQSDFPLTSRPYQAIGTALGQSEADIIQMIQSLKDRKIIRQISAIFHGTALGFTTTLVAFQLPEETLDQAAQIISDHPGVSHNYQREHPFNLWFTLAVPQELEITRHIAILAEMTGCTTSLYLPSTRMFKRQVQLEIADSLPKVTLPSRVSPRLSRKINLPAEIQHCLMRELSKDLPLSPTPFQDLARRCQVEEDVVFELLDDLQSTHTMSRFAGILRHRHVGFTANAMVVWDVPAAQVSAFVDTVIQYQAISHCYERVTYPNWPYNLYTMVHGTTKQATCQIIDDLASQWPHVPYEILYSGKEYKKQRVNYFSQDIYAWDTRHIGRPQGNQEA
ncbi:Lrp/AsnC family transcriptional regulator [candidate division KSB3 bacterium]|uniref:siroheme decarboxylase n=1 Tax=candidate division KSB3 bacterium TaxID=2044937 RepID=A0A9D5JYW4_9BACT|nr:Lrp/AsnC family transcriptional regulator [candidate division KSB3 bacterium]MBD3326919.1 Lrp/AsnC family transcriptional regulator [candidate division KSB3 bacterium]